MNKKEITISIKDVRLTIGQWEKIGNKRTITGTVEKIYHELGIFGFKEKSKWKSEIVTLEAYFKKLKKDDAPIKQKNITTNCRQNISEWIIFDRLREV